MRGDQIEVKTYDNLYNCIFKLKANLNNPREMQNLLNDLKAKGINLTYTYLE